jgi:isoamylase
MPGEGLQLHVMMNAFWEPLEFEVPCEEGSKPWRRWIDTSLTSPEDIVDWQVAASISDRRAYRVESRSVVVLWRPLDSPGSVTA